MQNWLQRTGDGHFFMFETTILGGGQQENEDGFTFPVALINSCASVFNKSSKQPEKK